MTTGTASQPIFTVEDIIEDRWLRATSRPARFGSEAAISPNTSKSYDRIHDSLEELAGRLAGEEVREGDYDDLQTVLDGLWATIGETLCAWAIKVQRAELEAKAARRVSVA